MKNISKAGLGVVGALVLILSQGAVASADVQPQASDIVGVGSDTVQFGMDFLADGDVNGHTGFNTTNQSRRVVNFDATGDACGAATTNATVVLRANSKPTALTRQMSRKLKETINESFDAFGTTCSASSHWTTLGRRTLGAHAKRPRRCCSAA